MSKHSSQKLFVRTEDVWRAMYVDIQAARTCVYLEMYIFNKNGAPYDFADLLVRKVKEGVRVHVIVDAWASGELPRVTIETLRKGGVQVTTFYSWFRRLHRKLLVVDERTAYVGGVNFYRSSKSWEDLALRLQGPIVNALVRSFHRLEHNADPKRVPLVHSPGTMPVTRHFKMWLVEHVTGKNHIGASYHTMITEAKREIIIVTPYFMPRRSFLHALEEARARGVVINVLIPKRTDQVIADRINHRYLRLLEGSGINFFLHPRMNHGKAMVVDRYVGILGSQNFDYLSLEVNEELGIMFSNVHLLEKLLTQISVWQNESEPYDRRKARRHFVDWFLFPFMVFFEMF